MISKKKVQELVEQRIAELNNGLFIVELNISATNVINVELDKVDGNVSINDCMSVSRNVEHNLDREEADFELHVSSAGLDKPLRVLAQYEKNVGRELKVVTTDGRKIEGKLTAADEKQIILEKEEKVKIEGKKKKELVVEQTVLPMNQVKEAKIIISFK